MPLNAETRAAFEAYFGRKEDQETALTLTATNPLFIDKSGERLLPWALTATVRKIGWAAKMAVTPASLRLTRLIQIARRGSDAITLANLGGFVSLESAKRIIRACKNDLTRASVEVRLDNIFGIGCQPKTVVTS